MVPENTRLRGNLALPSSADQYFLLAALFICVDIAPILFEVFRFTEDTEGGDGCAH